MTATEDDSLVEHATRAVRKALGRVCLAGDPRLLRAGENVVFAVPGVGVARVSRPGVPVELAARMVAAARWLDASGVDVVLPLPVEQPVLVDGVVVFLWQSLGGEPVYGSAEQLARLLRRLHAVPIPAEPELPAVDVFERFDRRLDAVPLPAADVDFLRTRGDELRAALATVTFPGPPVVLHGDASVGNVLLDQNGTPRFIDLDGLCTGPREWDLVLTALFYERFGWHTRPEYEAFCGAYGVDVMVWEGYPVLADIQELLMVSWIAQKAEESEALSAEVAMRIASLRNGRPRRDWVPY